MVGVSTVAGPVLGGLIVTYADWRWIFFLNVPVGVLVVVASLSILPDVRPGRAQGLDPIGVLLASTAIFLVVFGLIEGQKHVEDPAAEELVPA